MPSSPPLLPAPRNIKLINGRCNLSGIKLIWLDTSDPQRLLFQSSRIQDALAKFDKLSVEIYAGRTAEKNASLISLSINPQISIPPQGYQLHILPTEIKIIAPDHPGIFYACSTLVQIIQDYSPQFNPNSNLPIYDLPCMEIIDWPDFIHRGAMIDISRDKVPTMATMFDLVELLASWKINQLQMYMEHTFAYQNHPQVWAEASPFTGEEILKLDAYCSERYIELVPNQNSFGHLERWLKLPRYKPLSEAPDGFNFPWGRHDGPFSLCPLDSGSLSLLTGLYDELLPHFSSRQFNVGCDETFDVGQGRSQAECERVGKWRVYLDFLLKIHREVTKRGYTTQFWGDMILSHPEVVGELPKDMIALEWGYEASHPFNEHCKIYAESGLPFYVCPGTSSWNSIAGRTDNCLANLASAAEHSHANCADGYLITDWGDNGHWQALPVSYLGFAAGAALAWSFDANKDLDIKQALSLFAFFDPTLQSGSIMYDLGNLYRLVGFEPDNASALFELFQNPIQKWQLPISQEAAFKSFQHAFDVLSQVSGEQSKMSSMRPDNELLNREFALTMDLLRHACMRGLFGLGSLEYTNTYLHNDLERIIAEYKNIWLSRNRPGGLRESLTRFDIAIRDYQ